MTRREHEDGMRREAGLSAAEKANGFAAIMRRVNSHTPQEQAQLELEAEEVVLGHEAYALGHEYLDRGDLDAARRWLRVAADYRIPGAERALEELALRLTCEGLVDPTSAGAEQAAGDSGFCGPLPQPLRATDGTHRMKNIQAWTWGLDGMPDRSSEVAARWQAEQIIGQARREADAILAAARQEAEQIGELFMEARRQADGLRAAAHEKVEMTAAVCAERVSEVEKDRAEAARLLSEARQLVEEIQSQVAKLKAAARGGTRWRDGSPEVWERRAARTYEAMDGWRGHARRVRVLRALSGLEGEGEPVQKALRFSPWVALVAEAAWNCVGLLSETVALAATNKVAAHAAGVEEDVLAAYVETRSSDAGRAAQWLPPFIAVGSMRARELWSPASTGGTPDAGGEQWSWIKPYRFTPVPTAREQGVGAGRLYLTIVPAFGDSAEWDTRHLDCSRHALKLSDLHDHRLSRRRPASVVSPSTNGLEEGRVVLGEFCSHEPTDLRPAWQDSAVLAGAFGSDWLEWLDRLAERVDRLADGPRGLEQAPDELEEDEDSAATSAGSRLR
ncbi:ATP synthase F0 subunit B [Streptomyces sp. NPDC001269]